MWARGLGSGPGADVGDRSVDGAGAAGAGGERSPPGIDVYSKIVT